MLHDLKNACRSLLKAPWFTCVVVLTLALGLGANTAIFGVVNKLLLNPLPYADSDRLVYVGINFPGLPFGFPLPDFAARALREEARTLDRVEAFSPRSVLAYDESGARILSGMRITPSLPGLLGVAPVLGRGFSPADAEAGAPAVVMLGYEMWQRDYGGAPEVVGRALTLDETSYVVVGVLPPGSAAFLGEQRPDVWFPLSLDRPPADFEFFEVLARLPPGLSQETAEQEIETILNRALAASPRQIFGGDAVRARVDRPADRFGGSTREALLVLLAAVGLVLLVACSNVANLLLARGVSRARELALRSALGASAWRLVRASLAECLVLALAAGAVGIALGWATLRILVRLRPDSLGAPIGEVRLDATVLAFTFGISVVTALVFGLAPAAQLTSRKLGDSLRHGASGAVRGGSGAGLRKALVAAQMTLSVVLLVSAGLLVRSVIYLQNVDVGFDVANLFSAPLTLPRGRYEQPASREVLAEQLLANVRSMPGIAAVTQAHIAPPQYSISGNDFEIRGVTVSEADASGGHAFNYVRPNFFATLGIPMLQGRTFTADELRTGNVFVISQAAAQRFWPSGNAVGAEMKWGRNWGTVVGVAADVASGGMIRGKDDPQFYLPYQAAEVPSSLGSPPSMLLIVRAAGDPAVAMESVRAATKALDPEIAIPYMLLTETGLAATIDGPRFNMALLTAFAAIALVLAAVGLAAVIGYEVTERTHEFGIRMALGARTENVRRLAMKHGLTPAFVGVVLGVLGALAATRFAASMLYGIEPRDPL
ncbi:MAG TPA: ABC transporter permease, partial [Gammaproteobacteria bacterium]|nr:ABC transporter permease [Gammaproteobacteria bacterium]